MSTPVVRCRHGYGESGISQCKNRTRRGQYCNRHVPLVLASVTTDTCPICLEEKQLRMFRCGHGLCTGCRAQVRNVRCPMCRANNMAEFSAGELHRMFDVANVEREQRSQEEHDDLVRREQRLLPPNERQVPPYQLQRTPGHQRRFTYHNNITPQQAEMQQHGQLAKVTFNSIPILHVEQIREFVAQLLEGTAPQ